MSIGTEISSITSGITRGIETDSTYIISLADDDLSNSSIDEFRLYNTSEVDYEDIFYMGLEKVSDSLWNYTYHKELAVGSYNYAFRAYNDQSQYTTTSIYSFSVASFIDGNGSIINPYQIQSCESLNEVRKFLNSSFIMINDSNCSGLSLEKIGNETSPFAGNFNGNGHKIYGLNITSGNYTGLFGLLNNTAVISNLTIEDSNFTGDNYVGCLSGYSIFGSTINNVICSRINVNANQYSAGLIGHSSSLISEARVINSTITGTNYTGGILGYNNKTINNSRIINSIITGANFTGGISGINNGTISVVYGANNTVRTTTSTTAIGGLVGKNYLTLSNSFFSGKLIGNTNVGGLVGINNGTISNSYSDANISFYTIGESALINSGGIAGVNNGTISKVFSLSNTSTNCLEINLCAALVGINNGSIVDSYWLNSSNSRNNDGEFTYYDNAFCTASNTCWNNDTYVNESLDYFMNYTNPPMNYTKSNGWDFTTVWSYFLDDQNLPLLKNEI